MLRIAICDNDRALQKMLLDYIIRDTDIDDEYETECFNTIMEVKNRLDSNNFDFDLLFLMISESGKDSIALIEYIRQKKFDVDVIFMAASTNYIADAFRVKAFNYMVKPINYKKFVYEMRQYIQAKRERQKEYLSVTIKGKEHLIPLSTVLYFTSDVRKIGAFFLNDKKEIWFYGKLDNIEKQLNSYGYIRCHQSYLINGHKIESVEADGVITSGGIFPVSRKYAASVRKKWKEIKQSLYDKANIVTSDEMITNDFTGEDSTALVTQNYNTKISKYGTIVGVGDNVKNVSYRVYENDEVIIGRDSKQAHIVVNNHLVSRKHCSIRFNAVEQYYMLCDYSTNGTFLNGKGRVPKNQWIRVEKESLVQVVDQNILFMLI